jgi:hypothetical protein
MEEIPQRHCPAIVFVGAGTGSRAPRSAPPKCALRGQYARGAKRLVGSGADGLGDLQRYTAEAASDMTFLHAGVVGWQGRAIVLPGRSLSGKTTLVREMLRLGATYYSDEFAVVDNAGLVHPFPRPLGIREDSSYAQTKYSAETLGATSGVKPLPMGMAVICKYEAGTQWQPAAFSRGQGALELLGNSIAVRSQPHGTLKRLQKLASHAVFIKGTRGEASEAAASILNLSGALERLETA